MAVGLWGFWLGWRVRDGGLGVRRSDPFGLIAMRIAGLGPVLVAGSDQLGADVCILA
jgi:hypothetical protein